MLKQDGTKTFRSDPPHVVLMTKTVAELKCRKGLSKKYVNKSIFGHPCPLCGHVNSGTVYQLKLEETEVGSVTVRSH